MIVPSHMRPRGRVLPSMDEILEKVLAATPWPKISAPPAREVRIFKRTPCTPSAEALHIAEQAVPQNLLSSLTKRGLMAK